MRSSVVIGLLLFSQLVFALPKEVEVWFLSAPTTAQLKRILETYESMTFFKLLADADDPAYSGECQPMGDGCFHPQYGFLEKKKSDTEIKPELVPEDVPLEKVRTFNSLDVKMVDCNKNYHFDMFCGKEKRELASGANFEIWIDTSSSMRNVDYSKNSEYCGRRSFVSKVNAECPTGSVSFFTFDTGKKEMGDSSSVCINYGLNDGDRIVDWIEGSKAKKLLIITDIDELQPPLSDYLDLINAKIVGADARSLKTAELAKLTSQVIGQCKKMKK